VEAVDDLGMEARYVIFDLDDTLVHSMAVRAALASVADDCGIPRDTLARTLDSLPGRPAIEVFEALGLERDAARDASGRFLRVLRDVDARLPTVPYPDADTTLRALAASGSTLMLSTGSSPERARKVLEQEGWDGFSLVLGSDDTCRKGGAHYEQIGAEAADADWMQQAVTVGDSPSDMRLGAEHGVPVRIGIDRGGDAVRLLKAGATHVVSSLSAILPILAI
jgi:phosphoglycolate phosphatase-like HAD superfamily hydrolase